VPAATFAVTLPKDAKKVDDLHEALIKGTTDSLLGKPAPEVSLRGLDGAAVRLVPHAGKHVVVLIFWASWCAPSTEELPKVVRFVEAYRDKGVVFYAINVGEKAEDVKAFTAKSKLASTVLLDPEGKATDSFGVTA